MALNSSMESVADSVISQSETQGADSSAASAPAEQPSAAMIGVTEQPAAESQTPWQLAQGLDPNQVVGTIDGKPVTAAQLSEYTMRQADYTRKTQEIAEQRKTHESDLAWMNANRDYLNRLNSQDVNERLATLQEIAKNFGVDLNPRARDNQGRYTAQQQEGEGDLYDLSQIADPDQRMFAERHNRTVTEARTARSEVAELKATVQQMVAGVQTAQQQQQMRQQASDIAQQWAASGMQGADVEAALSRIGQPMTIQDAMMLGNLQKVLAHNANVARGTTARIPNEAGGLQHRQGASGAGMSLENYIRSTVE